MTEQDDFVKRVEAQLRDIGKRETKLSEQENALKKQRTELRGRAAELNRTLAVYRQVMETGTTLVAESAPEGTIADVAYAILQDHGGTMRMNDIVAELQRLGKLKGSSGDRADYGTVYATLHRDDRFIRADKGAFSLAPTSPTEPQPPS